MEANPIKEIIFGISFAETVSMEKLQRFIEIQDIKDAFPIIRPGYNANLKATTDGKPPVTDIEKAGYVLKCDEPCNRILQAKVGLLAFHKTREYQKYEELLPELNFYWNQFQKCTGKLNVTNVSLRYLNFIELDDNKQIADYVTIKMETPFVKVDHIFSSLKFKLENSNNTDATIVVTNGKDSNNDGVILDIILNRKIENAAYEDISEAFLGMRELKNDIFQKCITIKAKNKYKL